MITEALLQKLETLGFGSDIDALESYFGQLQDAAADGEPLVDDPVYDDYRRLLEQLKPESELLTRNWDKDSDEELADTDSILKEYGMRSIRTCSTMEDVRRYVELFSKIGRPVNLIASTKLNGHAGRVVYRHGDYVSSSARGRYKKGRSLYRQLSKCVPQHIEALEDFDLVEIRGEILVTLTDFDSYLYKLYKHPLSAVTSLVRDSVTDEELKYLNFVAYKIVVYKEEELFESLSEEMDFLDACGFKTAKRQIYENVQPYELEDKAEQIINDFEARFNAGEFEFYTDGIVVAIDNNQDFYSLGLDKNFQNGNFALKMGNVWESNIYNGVIQDILWEYGKRWIIPKALIYPVTTVTGASVTVVPMYNVGVMNKLHLVKGEPIFFRFGGEKGVQLVTSDGKSVTELEKVRYVD